MAAVGGICLSAFAIGYLAATTYLVMRDDLIGASMTRQAHLQQVYEDRISALREQVDRITSRQLLDQKLMEEKVAQLLKRQEMLTKRHGRLDPILKRAGLQPAVPDAGKMPSPDKGPEEKAQSNPEKPSKSASALLDTLSTGSIGTLSEGGAMNLSVADRADRLFASVSHSLKQIEKDQINSLDRLTTRTYETADAITAALNDAGIRISGDGEGDVGGPLVEDETASTFDGKVKELDTALDMLDAIRKMTGHLPVGNPAKGHAVTSKFGFRIDPFIGQKAMHTGMDFRDKAGSPIKPTASGTVVSAGWDGGYGQMVEIDHGNGYTTRYAHMSSISVKKGDTVTPDTVIGLVGSTGRSTGPHLHYEVRKDGKAVNPLPFIDTGKKIGRLFAAFRSAG